MAFMSKQMGLSPTEYYNKRILELKGTLGPVPMPKATRQNIIGFCRRMEPPSRQQTIPWCTTGKVPKCAGNTLDSFPWKRPPDAKKKGSKKPSKTLAQPSPSLTPRDILKSEAADFQSSILCSPESLIHLRSPPKPKNQTDDKPKPIPAPSYRDEHGVMITNITGMGDYDDDDKETDDYLLDDPDIPVMSVDTNPKLKKLHPRYCLKKFGMYFVRLERVVDPLDFFMEFIQKPPKDGCQDWSECLQHFYGDPKVAAQYKLTTLYPLVGQRYATYNDELEKWERVRVTGYSTGRPFAIVAFLDRLVPPVAINFGAFYELNPKFHQWPKYPLKGALKDIRPHNFVEGEDDHRAHFNFSQEAIQYFKEATTKDKIFRAFIIQKAPEKVEYFGYAEEDRFTTCMVYLFEVGKPMIPLNAEMVQKGFLKPIKSMECTMELIKTLHGLDLQMENPPQTIENQIENLHLDDRFNYI